MKSQLLLVTILLLFSCTEESKNERKVCDVAALNAELKSEFGLDLLSIKKKADSVQNIDNKFYLDLVTEMEGGPDKNCFKRANIPWDPKNIRGARLGNIEKYDSIADRIMHLFSQEMIMEDCSSKKPDSLCILKQDIQNVMSGKTDGQMSYNFFFPFLGELYRKNYIGQEEFHYLILFYHYLGAIRGEGQKFVYNKT